MTFRQSETEFSEAPEGSILPNERPALAAFLALVAAFMFFDIWDDWQEGILLHHIIIELVIGIAGISLCFYLLKHYLSKHRRAVGAAREELLNSRAAAVEWQEKAKSFRDGLSQAICQQMEAWKLTPTEQEICLLLLKGFSLQEIAELRKTTERTVRQQSHCIYRKSGLPGRVQLSAFFLEDLL